MKPVLFTDLLKNDQMRDYCNITSSCVPQAMSQPHSNQPFWLKQSSNCISTVSVS